MNYLKQNIIFLEIFVYLFYSLKTCIESQVNIAILAQKYFSNENTSYLIHSVVIKSLHTLCQKRSPINHKNNFKLYSKYFH